MSKFNYKYHRSRLKIEIVHSLIGQWVSVSEAVELMCVSETTIRNRVLKGIYPVVIFNGKWHIKLS